MDSAAGRRRDATANRERLIAAARKVFGSGDQGSLEAIAGEAGVGIATLYRHFPSRESLTQAVYRTIFQTELVPLLRDVCAHATARQAFVLVVERLLALVDRERGLIASSADFAVLTDGLLREFVEPFTILLRRAQASGEMRPDLEPYDIPRLLGILVVGLSTPTTTAAVRQRYLSLFFDALQPEEAQPLPPLAEKDVAEGARSGFEVLRIAGSSAGSGTDSRRGDEPGTQRGAG